MSDRSFGDHAFRNVVKNPLLSTSVTGLSIEDLTHNAVLLPAVPSQEMSTRRDERSGSQTRTLRHSEHDIANLPSGDTNLNIYPPSSHTNVDSNHPSTQSARPNESSTSNVSKASAKSDDDFDVNEYFARLQGTRYVSAPLNSTLKEDQNANLQASEENLEEINLNEPEKTASPDVQQSITADIAQNFSQLPTVLPQMASVVFNSFSNMLSMKSREQTPDDSKSFYQETSMTGIRPAEPNVPMMGVPDIVKDIAPPPLKEPPPVGTANYRITTRKKVYAQIPGLTSGETHNMTTYNQPAVSQAAPNYFVPDNPAINTGEIDRDESKEIDNKPSILTDFNSTGTAVEVKSSTYDIFTPNVVNDAVRDVNVFNPAQSEDTASEQVNPLSHLANQTVQSTQSFVREAFAPPMNTHGPGTSVPPPPVSITPLKADSQASVGRSVLPPSVARRISANQPIIKSQPVPMPQFSNIFVPQSINEPTQGFDRPSGTINAPLSTSSVSQSETVLPAASLPPVQTILTPVPPSSAANVSTIIEPPMEVKPATSVLPNLTQVPPASFPSNVLPSVPFAPMVSQEQNSSPAVRPPPIKPSMLPPTSRKLTPPSEPVTGTMQLSEDKPIVPNVSQTLFSPSSSNLPQEAVISATRIVNPDKNISTPPMFFNPVSAQSHSNQVPMSSNIAQQNVMPQFFNPNDMPPAPTTSVPEPPKIQGNTNYRMTKKKPQYYSGPIEGVGSISNNIKPVLNPVQSTSFQGSLFTPQEPPQSLTQSEPSYLVADSGVGQIPFDNFTMPPISNHNLTSSVTSVPQEQIPSHYNTAFDFSRPANDRYEPPKQESSGFGLIGSLKSKLSSIDIGKIQSTVTTFFDPAYNDVKTEQSNQPNYSNEFYNPNNSSSSRQPQEQAALEMFVVPSADPTPQFYNNYNQGHATHQSHYGFNDQMRTEPTFQPTSYNYQVTQNQYGHMPNQSDPLTKQTTNIGHQQPTPPTRNQYGATELFNLGVVFQPMSQINQYQDAASQYGIGSQITTEPIAQATSQSHFGIQEQHRSDTTSQQIQNTEFSASTSQLNTSSQISMEPTFPNIIHEDKLQATTDSQRSINEQEQSESTVQPMYNQDNQGAAQRYGFNEEILRESISQENSNQYKETSQSVHNVVEQKLSEPTYQQSSHSVYPQALSELNDEDKERIINETKAALEALANVLDPGYADREAKAKAKAAEKQFMGPTILFSNPRSNDDSVSTYPRLLTDEPLTEEQHRKAYEEFINRSADIFDGDTSHIIEPPSRESTPEVKQTISAPATTNIQMQQNQNVPAPSTSVFDYGYNSDFVSQYLSENRATPSGDNALKYDSSSDNTGSDSLRYFIPYKPTPQTLEIIAKMGDITLSDYDTHKEEDKFTNVVKGETEEKEINDVTKQLIENITAPIQLSNPVEVPLAESDVVIDDNPEFSSNQFAEISHITEETIETIQVQSATELLQDSNVDDTVLKNYIWRSKDAGMSSTALGDHTYSITPDTHHTSFPQNTSLFFDNVLTNASDELKAECKHSLDEHIVLPRQMSIPTAPPADDSKSDEGVLDVQSIEQDAKQDFMFIHEMTIEPETDDGKIKELEKTSDDDAKEVESFTHRVEKYKQLEETTVEDDQVVDKPSSKPYPSYFDTGNFAADNHYKNSVPQQNFQPYQNAPMRIPPGFEQEYYRKCNLMNQTYIQSGTQDDFSEVTKLSTKNDNENVPQIPDTTTQTSVTQCVTVSSANSDDLEKVETSSDKINALVEQFLIQKNEIKPRRMTFKRNIVPLAHCLGMSPERMRELMPHHVTHSPPSERASTEEEVIDRILARISYIPYDDNESEGTHSDDNAPVPSTSNDESSENRNIPHVIGTNDREKESKEEIDTPAENIEPSDNQHRSEINSQLMFDHQSASSSQVNIGQSTTNETKSLDLPAQSLTSTECTPQQQTSFDNPSASCDPINFFNSHLTASSTADHKSDDKNTHRHQETRTINTSSLPDPASFFTTQATAPTASSSNADDDEEHSSFSRLSSYFAASPSKKEDHSKSFFELSQSQNHYRQNQPIQTTRVIEQNVSRFFDSASNTVLTQNSNSALITTPQNIPQHLANMNLVRELASTKHFTPPNVVTTANYFTIHYDHDVGNLSKGEPDHIKTENRTPVISDKTETNSNKSLELGELGDTNKSIDEKAVINSCKYCCDMTSGRITKFDIESVDLNGIIKHVMDSNTDNNKSGDISMEDTTEVKRKVGHTVNFDPSSLQEDSDETDTMMSEVYNY